jgi:hypothetical protein
MWYKIELLGSDIKNKSNSVDLYYVIYINWPKINPEKVVDCLNFEMEEVTVNTESDREILTNMRAKMP